MSRRNILIGGAWPYGNSSLHLGHIAGLISGDVLARYYRLRGDNVLYVSGTDCHGTPITERAKKEGISPKEIATKYDEEFHRMFDGYQFSYDLYSRTFEDYHKNKVMEIVKKLYDNGYVYEKLEPQAYCEHCQKFLQDREITLTCPECGEETKGDQCDNCLHVPTVEELLKGNCIECGSKLVEKENKVLYLALSKFQDQILEHTEKVKSEWRINAQNETLKYIKQGLLDRAITRDLSWGVDVPIPGYDDKRLYVWIDAVLGYLTDTMRLCENRTDCTWEDFWKEGHNNKIFMCHLVDTIVSAEYLNFNDQKFSKSKGIGMTALEALDLYDSDSLRYHLITNGPEKKDTNFTIEDFENTHNGEILNKFGNLVNRTLKFKGIEEVPNGNMDKDVEKAIKDTYDEVAKLVESLEFREASKKIMELVELGNKYYDDNQPWIARKEDENKFNDIIYTCTVIIANLSNLYEMIMPTACKNIRKYLNLPEPKWDYIEVEKGLKLENIEPLFTRYEKK